jgi:hypothetical protein
MRLWKIALLIALFVLAACAPEDLDITPTVTPTNTPQPTSTPQPRPTADPAATPSTEDGTEVTAEAASVETTDGGLLDQLVAAVPDQLNAGAIQWRRSTDEVSGEELVYQDIEGGRTAKMFFSERGGGASELTFGVFDTPEAAQAYYDVIRGRLRTLENAQTRDTFPLPNAFGGGTYGSDAIFVQDNLFIRISVPRFSSTAGDPLVPYSRAVFQLVDGVTGTSS